MQRGHQLSHLLPELEASGWDTGGQPRLLAGARGTRLRAGFVPPAPCLAPGPLPGSAESAQPHPQPPKPQGCSSCSSREVPPHPCPEKRENSGLFPLSPGSDPGQSLPPAGAAPSLGLSGLCSASGGVRLAGLLGGLWFSAPQPGLLGTGHFAGNRLFSSTRTGAGRRRSRWFFHCACQVETTWAFWSAKLCLGIRLRAGR